MKRIHNSLRLKWMVLSILLSTLPLVIASYSIIQIYQRDLKQSVIAIEKEKAKTVVGRTRSYFERIRSNLRCLSIHGDFRRGNSPAHAKGLLKNFLSQNGYLSELTLLDVKGQETIKISRYKTFKPSDLKDQSKTEMFETASNLQTYYGDFKLIEHGVPTLVIAVPVEEHGRRPARVLSAEFDLRHLWSVIQQTQVGKKGMVYVVDRAGYPIAHPDTTRVTSRVNMGQLPMVGRAIAGEEGTLEFEDPGGEKYLVVFEPIKELGWSVIVQVPVNEAYEPLQRVAQAALRWILIVLAVALVVSFLLTRKLSLPIKQLAKEMGEVAQGNLNVYMEPRTKDELGGLTRSFNKMIQDLKRSQDALKETKEKYRRVFEDSKDMLFMTSADGKLVEVNQAGVDLLGYGSKEEMMQGYASGALLHPKGQERIMEGVREEGFVKDLEVKLKRRDGAPIDVLVTVNARRDDSGRIVSYEGMIKDISDRKKMEEELVQRTKELEALNEMGALINQTLDIDRVLPIALEKAVHLTGYEMGGVHLANEDERTFEFKYHFQHSTRLAEMAKMHKYGEGAAGRAVILRRPVIFSVEDHPSSRLAPILREEGVQTILAFPLFGKGKVVGAISLLSRVPRDLSPNEVHLLENIGNQVGLALVNAKLFSEVAKAKSEWETTFNSVTDLLTIRDKDYRVILANKAALKRFGLKPEEFVGKKCFEVFRQSDKPCAGCYVSETLFTKNPVSIELESPYLKGIFQFHTFPVFGETGELVGVVELAREVTREKRLEIEKDVVNNVNKILASSLDVKQVIQAVQIELKRVLDCERMGVALFDGEGKGFQILLMSKEFEFARLAPGTVYPQEGTRFRSVAETGLPVIVADTGESDCWTDQELLKEGIRSCLLFPLEYKGKIIGTMNFGSRKTNHFSEASFGLLQQIAPGLAISIQNALLFEETKKRLDELIILYEIMKISASSLSLDQMLKETIYSLNRFFKFEVFGIALTDGKKLVLHPSFIGHSIQEVEKLGLSLGKGITGWVAEKGEPLLVNDVRNDSRYVVYDESIRSEMCVPLKVGQRVIGVIDTQSRALNTFSEDDLRLLKIAGGQIATVIENIRLRDEIKQSEEKYRTVVESALDGVCVFGGDYRLKFVNQRFAEILGFTREELINMDVREFLDEEGRQVVADREERRKRGVPLSPSFESKVLGKDGRVRNGEINARTIKDSKGDVSTIAILKDITEKKKMEEELFRTEKLSAIAEMASGVAHDFNNALAAILGNTQLLLYTAKDQETKETLQTIAKVAQDSAHTVRRLQDFTKKRVSQELSSVDVNSVIKDSIEITKPKWKDEAQRKGVSIEIVSTLEEIPPVSGNDSELRGVLTNMILNAIEAMPEGGKIEITTSKKRGSVVIQISDTGIGIAAEVKKKIFEPFFTTKPFTNTGLGLSMSYGIIKRFGGEIEVVSEQGYGTTFSITLPVGETEEDGTTFSQTVKQGRRARILVIDDEEVVRSVLSRTLGNGNHQVTLAANGERGVQLFQEGTYDIVLTDLGMPGMSGWEVCRMIKKISPGTPVGMITGWGSEMSQSKIDEYGLDFLISKPFDLNQLLNVVAETMESKRG